MILVVEHDPEVLEKAQKILNRDRKVFLASTAERAFDLVQRLGFSVALIDLDLPDGAFELIRRLRDADPGLFIIAINGAIEDAPRQTAKALGVVEVLEKPITPAWKPVVESIRSRRASA